MESLKKEMMGAVKIHIPRENVFDTYPDIMSMPADEILSNGSFGREKNPQTGKPFTAGEVQEVLDMGEGNMLVFHYLGQNETFDQDPPPINYEK